MVFIQITSHLVAIRIGLGRSWRGRCFSLKHDGYIELERIPRVRWLPHRCYSGRKANGIPSGAEVGPPVRCHAEMVQQRNTQAPRI